VGKVVEETMVVKDLMYVPPNNRLELTTLAEHTGACRKSARVAAQPERWADRNLM